MLHVPLCSIQSKKVHIPEPCFPLFIISKYENPTLENEQVVSTLSTTFSQDLLFVHVICYIFTD